MGSTYPVKGLWTNYTCPKNLPVFKPGARVSGYYYTYKSDADLMKKLVYKHGAVVSSILTIDDFRFYKGGVFGSCRKKKPGEKGCGGGHAVLVVGYGVENGIPYWLIKNSYNTNWGENGFMKLKQGIKGCYLEMQAVVTTCEAVPGPTSRPLTTQRPCIDRHTYCGGELGANDKRRGCWLSFMQESCPKSCGMCPGMTPHRSYSCHDSDYRLLHSKRTCQKSDCNTDWGKKWCNGTCTQNCKPHHQPFTNCLDMHDDCPVWAKTMCGNYPYNEACRKSCGLCEGMKPVPSYYCSDSCGCRLITEATKAKYCKDPAIAAKCKQSCGQCKI